MRVKNFDVEVHKAIVFDTARIAKRWRTTTKTVVGIMSRMPVNRISSTVECDYCFEDGEILWTDSEVVAIEKAFPGLRRGKAKDVLRSLKTNKKSAKRALWMMVAA